MTTDARATHAPGLRLFLDSAEPAVWAELLPWGSFHGITTNPLLLARAKLPCSVTQLRELALAAAELGAGEIQMQVWGDDAAAMVAVGQELAALATARLPVTLKVPATAEGLRVAARLRQLGYPVTLTAVYTEGQVLHAAGLGAAYAAPYLGRMTDAGLPGRETILGMAQILRNTGGQTRLLVASLRDAAQVVELARAGLDTFTFGPAVAAELLASDLTTRAAAEFAAAAGPGAGSA